MKFYQVFWKNWRHQNFLLEINWPLVTFINFLRMAKIEGIFWKWITCTAYIFRKGDINMKIIWIVHNGFLPLCFLQSLLKQKVMPKRKQNYYNGDKKVTRTEQCIFVVKKRCLVFSTFASQATVAGSSRFWPELWVIFSFKQFRYNLNTKKSSFSTPFLN